MERIDKGDSDAELQENSTSALELRFWASYRGQTLARTGLKALFTSGLHFKVYLRKLRGFSVSIFLYNF